MSIYRKLEHRNKNVQLQHHGIDKAAFDAPSPSPYEDPGLKAVFVGTSHLDRDFLSKAAAAFPAWQFHVIGPFRDLPSAANIRAWGELPYAETVPFITHADIGLATRTTVRNAEVLSDSLKVIQYTYARLPVVAPEVLGSARSNVISYRPGDPVSIRTALQRAAALDRSTISREGILSWDELAAALAGSPAA
jgi:2-beta-glucuronyltransferase